MEMSYSEYEYWNVAEHIKMLRVKLLTCDQLGFVVDGILSDFRQKQLYYSPKQVFST